jgi:hypothetical protein
MKSLSFWTGFAFGFAAANLVWLILFLTTSLKILAK